MQTIYQSRYSQSLLQRSNIHQAYLCLTGDKSKVNEGSGSSHPPESPADNQLIGGDASSACRGPCHNGGSCIGSKCVCRPGYQGEFCSEGRLYNISYIFLINFIKIVLFLLWESNYQNLNHRCIIYFFIFTFLSFFIYQLLKINYTIELIALLFLWEKRKFGGCIHP